MRRLSSCLTPLFAVLTVAAFVPGCGAAPASDQAASESSATSGALAGPIALGTALVTTTRVNLRRGPSTTQPILRTLPTDTVVVVVNRTMPTGPFFNVRAGTDVGWVHGAYLALAPQVDPTEDAGGGGETTTTDAGGQTTGNDPASVCPSASSGNTIVVAPSGKIQAGLDAAAPGDTVLVRAGIYHEGVSFRTSGSPTAGCITLKGEPGAIIDGSGSVNVGIHIDSRSYVAVVGMTVQNIAGGDTPIGISVSGSANHVEVRNNVVHHVTSSSNAHGIAFYGTSTTPMSNLLVDGNEIRNCKLGQSESMVFNGNVTDFVVSRNLVHDNDNIGIDFIGYEGNGPSGSDQARNGVCVDNVVYNISSANNPTYGGERSADGIYVDGGRDIVIERNKVKDVDVGIEVASEHQGRTTQNITVRNNFVARSYQGNVMIGGYASNKGNARNITVAGNTLYQAGDGEIILQYNSSAILIANNVCVAKSGNDYVLSSGGNNSGVTLDTNLFFGASTHSAGSFSDPHGKFADPLLVGAPSDLHLGDGSPAIDTGKDLGLDATGAPVSGTSDVDDTARTNGGRIDIGADER